MAVRALAACMALGAAAGCRGQGEGQARGSLSVPLCEIDGEFDLEPDFYGANRAGLSLTMRVQHGGANAEYANNLMITVDDTDEVARRIAASAERDPEGNPVATLPVGPAGVAGTLVHATLSPNHDCGRVKASRLGQNVGLVAQAGSTISFRSIDRGDDVRDASGQADTRLTDVTAFHFVLSDPRAIGSPPSDFVDYADRGVTAYDPVGHGDLSGWFRFHFARPAPAQLFP